MQQVKYDPIEELARIPDDGKRRIGEWGDSAPFSDRFFTALCRQRNLRKSTRVRPGHQVRLCDCGQCGLHCRSATSPILQPQRRFLCGQTPRACSFIEGAPVFAVEVRRKTDDGRAGKRRQIGQRKRSRIIPRPGTQSRVGLVRIGLQGESTFW